MVWILIGFLVLIATAWGLTYLEEHRLTEPSQVQPASDTVVGPEVSRFGGTTLERADLLRFFVTLNYGDHYRKWLQSVDDRQAAVAELFLFRGWTTQFGFRIFSTKPQVSEQIIGEVVNQSKYIGKELLYEVSGSDVEEDLGGTFIRLLEERWQEYDRVFEHNRSADQPIPTRKVCARVAEFCGHQDPFQFIWLCEDFIKHLREIRELSITTGLASNDDLPPSAPESSQELDPMDFLGTMKEMAEEAERVHRNLVGIVAEEFQEASPAPAGIYKARLKSAVMTVYAFLQYQPDQDEARELLNVASGLALEPVVEASGREEFGREEARTVTAGFLDKCLRATARACREGPNVLGREDEGFLQLAEMVHESLRDSIGNEAYTAEVRDRLDHLIQAFVGKELNHIRALATASHGVGRPEASQALGRSEERRSDLDWLQHVVEEVSDEMEFSIALETVQLKAESITVLVRDEAWVVASVPLAVVHRRDYTRAKSLVKETLEKDQGRLEEQARRRGWLRTDDAS